MDLLFFDPLFDNPNENCYSSFRYQESVDKWNYLPPIELWLWLIIIFINVHIDFFLQINLHFIHGTSRKMIYLRKNYLTILAQLKVWVLNFSKYTLIKASLEDPFPPPPEKKNQKNYCALGTYLLQWVFHLLVVCK